MEVTISDEPGFDHVACYLKCIKRIDEIKDHFQVVGFKGGKVTRKMHYKFYFNTDKESLQLRKEYLQCLKLKEQYDHNSKFYGIESLFHPIEPEQKDVNLQTVIESKEDDIVDTICLSIPKKYVTKQSDLENIFSYYYNMIPSFQFNAVYGVYCQPDAYYLYIITDIKFSYSKFINVDLAIVAKDPLHAIGMIEIQHGKDVLVKNFTVPLSYKNYLENWKHGKLPNKSSATLWIVQIASGFDSFLLGGKFDYIKLLDQWIDNQKTKTNKQ